MSEQATLALRLHDLITQQLAWPELRNPPSFDPIDFGYERWRTR